MADGKVTPPHTPLPRVRTYARDLEEQRGRREVSKVTALPSAATSSTSTPVAPPKPTPSLPPTNDHTSAPLPTKTKVELSDLDSISAGPSLSQSVAAAVFATTKREPESTPVAPASVSISEPKAPPIPTPTSIPPFHELTRTSRPATTRTGGTASTSTTDFGATIITDTQSRRFKLFPRLFSSLSSWWKARAKKRAAAQAPKYVIPEADRRKGVIQRATSQTAKVTTGDYEGLRQRLRDRVEATVADPTPEAPDTDPDETFWTPHIESIFPLLEAPQHTPSSVVSVTLTPRRKIDEAELVVSPENEVDRWAEAATAYNTPTTIAPTPDPTPIFTPPEPEPIPAPVVAQIRPTPTPPPLPETAEDVDEDTPLPAPTRPTPSTNAKRRPVPQPTPKRFFFQTNTLTVSIVGVVVLGSLAVYLTPRILEIAKAPETTPAATQSGIIAAPVVTRPLSLPSRDNIMTALNIAEEERTLPAVEVALSGEADPTIILQTIDPTLPPSLVQNISNLSFGWYDRSEPFIIMTITDRTGVWGSMLQNEDRLPKVLSPLFTTTSSGGSFVDRVVGGHDVRTLVDDTKNEVLSYGLIDDHTLIITTDTSTFLSVETLVTTVH